MYSAHFNFIILKFLFRSKCNCGFLFYFEKLKETINGLYVFVCKRFEGEINWSATAHCKSNTILKSAISFDICVPFVTWFGKRVELLPLKCTTVECTNRFKGCGRWPGICFLPQYTSIYNRSNLSSLFKRKCIDYIWDKTAIRLKWTYSQFWKITKGKLY